MDDLSSWVILNAIEPIYCRSREFAVSIVNFTENFATEGSYSQGRSYDSHGSLQFRIFRTEQNPSQNPETHCTSGFDLSIRMALWR